MAVQLGVWHIRTSTADRDFASGPFLPPSSPRNPNAELQQELERLRVERNEALSAAQRAEEAHREARLAAETAEARHQREQVERKTWEALAQDADRQLRDFVEHAQRQAPAAKMSFVTAANEAAGVIDLDEQATRALIDQQLRDRGWEAHSVDLRYAKGTRPVKGRHMAIAEWPTQSGPADYALFVGGTCVGIVEAKRYRKNISAAVDQAERYSKGFAWPDNSETWGAGFTVPFVFATNGRPYLKQVETGLSRRDEAEARAAPPRPAPSVSQAKRALAMMPAASPRDLRDKAVFALLCLTGVRVAALVSLRIKHVNLTEQSVTQNPREVATKFGKSIDTFFARGFDEAEVVLRAWLAHLDEVEFYSPDDPLFPATALVANANAGFTAKGFERRHWQSTEPVRKIVRAAFEHAGLPNYGPHAFRHMLARHAVNTSTSVAEFVANTQNLGHSDVLTTLRSYGQISRERQRELVTGKPSDT